MLDIIIFFAILGLLILVHEFGHFYAAKKNGVRVEQFALGFGPKVFSVINKDTEYRINAIPLGGFVKLAGDTPDAHKGSSDEYLSKLPGQRASIIFAGPLLNYVLGIFCFWLIFFTGFPAPTAKVGGVLEDFGAAKAGIKEGDRIISVDGKQVKLWEEMQGIVSVKKEGDSAELVISRDNKEYKFTVKVKEEEYPDLIADKHRLGLIGITPSRETIKIRHGIIASLGLAVDRTWELTVITYKSLWRMATGRLSLRKSVTGPLGIFYITSQAASAGVQAIISIIAVLSISLAIFNFLPLPVLDGGHILFLAIEKLRGRRLSEKAEGIITNTGLGLLISLAVFVMYNDFMRFYGDKIADWFKK